MDLDAATFSKATPLDVVFTVTSNAAVTIGSVKNGGTAINSSNYTFVDNVLTIKAAYLSGLANGAKTITIGMLVGDGDLIEHVATVAVGD